MPIPNRSVAALLQARVARAERDRDAALADAAVLRAQLAASLARELDQFGVESSLRVQLRLARSISYHRPVVDPPVQIPQQRGSDGLRPAARGPARSDGRAPQ